MEKLINNKQFNILKWIFIAISIIYVLYASITMRGMYMDGGFCMLDLLNKFSDNIYSVSADIEHHPRFFISFLMQLPLFFCRKILLIHNKYALMMIFTFSQIALPLFALWLNYKLAQRTNRPDLFFWSLFCYGGILIIFSIFSVVEILIGAMLHFLLWNYLSSEIKYTKKDIIAITALIVIMFATYEYVVLLGVIFFIASIYYMLKDKNIKNRAVKIFIGLGSLAASVFDLLFILKVPDENNEILRFFNESYDFIINSYNQCLVFTIITIILSIIIISAKNTKISGAKIFFISLIYVIAFIRLINIPEISVNPAFEGHYRTIPCWALPLIFTGLYVFDLLNKKINTDKLINLICIALICSTMQTCWQMVNTYYWDKNIQYLKKEISQSDSLLYIPSEHPEISSFFNPELRRYIWHSSYTFTSVLFSDEYKPKSVLMHYDEIHEPNNLTFREILYTLPSLDYISMPYGTTIKAKNEYWDLSEFAQALDKYNKDNNIPTLISKSAIIIE